MAFDLSQLGWKGFQDLASAIAADVLQRPVQTFLPTNDGGRDAAFVGTWSGAPDGPEAKSTIQCKFTTKTDARLTLSELKPELPKASSLAAAGLAHDYVIISNARITGKSEAAICKAFEAAGVKRCRVFDGGWIVHQIQQRPRLRMMVPRLYGLFALGELITGPAYDQARAILAAMGDDLGAFVPTQAHGAAVAALEAHGFVLLVGDPASGKSTIAATLALGAMDSGCSGAIRVSTPEMLDLWRPHERQFLWVDDAFGATQYEPGRVHQWNAELPRLRAAIKEGARVVFTTRNYIWERARHALKLSAFALLEESQIVVDVEALTQPERARILYNHVRAGGHSPETRAKLKPHLARLSHNPRLTPEIARRLGDPFITKRLTIRAESLDKFVDEPVDFLRDVISKLSDAGRAALALIFMHPAAGVPSPIPEGHELATVRRLTGATRAEISQELEAMRGSLTLLAPGSDCDHWTMRHPTIADAFGDLVAASPEQVELYVAGARLTRFMVEVVCGPDRPLGAKVRIPTSLYSQVIQRLAKQKCDRALKTFLATRCDPPFLAAFVTARPEILSAVTTLSPWLEDSEDPPLLAALYRAGCLPDALRRLVAEKISAITVEDFDIGVFVDANVRALITDGEYDALFAAFKARWIDDLKATFHHWRYDWSSSDELGMAVGFKDTLERIEGTFCTVENAAMFVAVHEHFDEWIGQLEEDEPSKRSAAGPAATASLNPLVEDSIFDDIDA